MWRPAVTVLKLLVEAWGDDATAWVGRRAELYGDPDIKFGSDKVGGIRVSRLSHIAKRVTANLTETRGKRRLHTVDPLPDEVLTTATLLAQIKEAADAAQVDIATIAAEWEASHDGQKIREATDIGSLELIRDDLRSKTTPASQS